MQNLEYRLGGKEMKLEWKTHVQENQKCYMSQLGGEHTCVLLRICPKYYVH